MIHPSDPNHTKLVKLFIDRQDLFAPIPNEFLLREDAEEIYQNGKSNLIRLGSGTVYRFNWEDVEEFGISP